MRSIETGLTNFFKIKTAFETAKRQISAILETSHAQDAKRRWKADATNMGSAKYVVCNLLKRTVCGKDHRGNAKSSRKHIDGLNRLFRGIGVGFNTTGRGGRETWE
jgi:hypothetical protein